MIKIDPTIRKRVAIAPHTDEWMRGYRYGVIRDYVLGTADRPTRYLVEVGERRWLWFDADDLNFGTEG